MADELFAPAVQLMCIIVVMVTLPASFIAFLCYASYANNVRYHDNKWKAFEELGKHVRAFDPDLLDVLTVTGDDDAVHTAFSNNALALEGLVTHLQSEHIISIKAMVAFKEHMRKIKEGRTTMTRRDRFQLLQQFLPCDLQSKDPSWTTPFWREAMQVEV